MGNFKSIAIKEMNKPNTYWIKRGESRDYIGIEKPCYPDLFEVVVSKEAYDLLVDDLKYFIKRVEDKTITSKETYDRYKATLEKLGEL